MQLRKWFLIASAAGMFGACAQSQAKTQPQEEVVPATPVPSTEATIEDEELQEKLSRLSDSLKALADTMSKNAEKGGAAAKKDMAAIEAELAKVGDMLRKGAQDSEKTGRKAFGKVVDEMDHLVKRMKESLD